MGTNMTGMDSIKYSQDVAAHVAAAITKSGKSVLSIAEMTGIPRTTLLRRLQSPETSPLTVNELSRLSEATGEPIGVLVDPTAEKENPQVPAAGEEPQEQKER